MMIIGLTGGIGTGKTTVARLFAECNIPVIDADNIAHYITEPRQPAYEKMIAHFGPQILQDGDEKVNRRALRQIIFTDEDERIWLEKLLHPLIFAEIKKQITNLNTPYCVIVIPLLIEVGPVDFIDRILVVDSSEEQQIQRVATRDQISPQQVHAILAAQISREMRLAKAHDIIHNISNLEELKAQVVKLHAQYLQARDK